MDKKKSGWAGVPIWVRLCVLALALVLGSISIQRAHSGTDMDGFVQGAVSLLKSGQISDHTGIERYPPTFQLFMAPLAAFDIAVAVAIFAGINLLACLALPSLFEKLSGVSIKRQGLAWLVALPFVADNIFLCQSGPLLLMLSCAGLLWARNKKGLRGGGLIAIAAMMKVLPVVFVAVPLILRRIWRPVIGFVVTACAFVGILAAIAGFNETILEFKEWAEGARNNQSAWAYVTQGRSLRHNNQGLAISIARTFSEVNLRKKGDIVRLASLPLGVSFGVYYAICAVMGLFWLVCAWHARRVAPDRAWTGLFALTAIGMLAVSPLVWTHYFLWILPAVIFLAERKRLLGVCAALSIVMLAIPEARALGFHIYGSVVIFFVVARGLLKTVPEPTPAPASEAAG